MGLVSFFYLPIKSKVTALVYIIYSSGILATRTCTLYSGIGPTSQLPSFLDGLVDYLEAFQQLHVIIGAYLVAGYNVLVQIVQLHVCLLHVGPAEQQTPVKKGT